MTNAWRIERPGAWKPTTARLGAMEDSMTHTDDKSSASLEGCNTAAHLGSRLHFTPLYLRLPPRVYETILQCFCAVLQP